MPSNFYYRTKTKTIIYNQVLLAHSKSSRSESLRTNYSSSSTEFSENIGKSESMNRPNKLLIPTTPLPWLVQNHDINTI